MLHLPAAIKNLLRHRGAAVSDFGRCEVVQRTSHTIGDAPGDEALINWVWLALADGLQGPTGM